MHPISRVSTPPLSTPVRTNDSLVYDNAAVGHQLGVDRNDMLAPGKESRFDTVTVSCLIPLNSRIQSADHLYGWHHWYEAYT